MEIIIQCDMILHVSILLNYSKKERGLYFLILRWQRRQIGDNEICLNWLDFFENLLSKTN
jgi:hypothetical protein